MAPSRLLTALAAAILLSITTATLAPASISVAFAGEHPSYGDDGGDDAAADEEDDEDDLCSMSNDDVSFTAITDPDTYEEWLAECRDIGIEDSLLEQDGVDE